MSTLHHQHIRECQVFLWSVSEFRPLKGRPPPPSPSLMVWRYDVIKWVFSHGKDSFRSEINPRKSGLMIPKSLFMPNNGFLDQKLYPLHILAIKERKIFMYLIFRDLSLEKWLQHLLPPPPPPLGNFAKILP